MTNILNNSTLCAIIGTQGTPYSICFEYGAGVRELAVPIVPLGDLPTLVKQLHIALDHAGRDKLLKVARTKNYHPQLAKAVIKVVQSANFVRSTRGAR